MQTGVLSRSGNKSYVPPQLIELGSLQSFVLGGPNPGGADVALPEEDGSASKGLYGSGRGPAAVEMLALGGVLGSSGN